MNSNEHSEQLEQLVFPHIDMLVDVAYKLTGEAEAAESLARMTLLKTFRPGAKRPPHTHVKSWLLTTLRQTFLDDFAKKNGRRQIGAIDIAAAAACCAHSNS